jgi:hypothetical protein
MAKGTGAGEGKGRGGSVLRRVFELQGRLGRAWGLGLHGAQVWESHVSCVLLMSGVLWE